MNLLKKIFKTISLSFLASVILFDNTFALEKTPHTEFTDEPIVFELFDNDKIDKK